ncbi:nucleotidyltransferase/DNA polymerase involved in DNA repair [Mycobacterium tuberculosis]|nr:nucleotidyltransferase/DNA polymerase involved in DNA repair [Mycobacterium tuberculosis]
MASARVLAIWCMDWPAVAAAAAAGLSATAPVAVTLANRVIACSATARAAGVRRGLRRREAAARCPQLFIATADADRDARLFEGVIAAVDDLVPRAELLRPGLLVLPVRGPARFFGSELDGGRAADRRGGRGRRGVSGRNRRPVVYRGFRRACWPHRGAGRRCAVSVAAVDPPTCHRAEPVRAGPGRPDGSVVEDGDSHHRTVRRAVSYRRGVQVRCRRGGRAPVRPRRTGTARHSC